MQTSVRPGRRRTDVLICGRDVHRIRTHLGRVVLPDAVGGGGGDPSELLKWLARAAEVLR